MGVLGGKEALETITENDKDEYNYYPLNPAKLEKQIDEALTKEGIDVSDLNILRRDDHPSGIDRVQMMGDKIQRPWNMLYKYRKLGSLGTIWPLDEKDFYWQDVTMVESFTGLEYPKHMSRKPSSPMFYLSMSCAFPLWIFTVVPEAHLINFPFNENYLKADSSRQLDQRIGWVEIAEPSIPADGQGT